MNELIKVENKNGKQIVSCRDLYEGLELNKAHWKRWSVKNIIENEYFKEGEDWVGFTIMVNGNETQDFAITLDFAKHIAMMARTEKSHQYRNYFIECEKQLKDVSTKDKYISEIDIAKAELSLVEATAKLLNLNDSSKLALATNIYENHNIPTNLLPQYTKSKDRILPVSDLLKKNYINMSAIAFNKLLVEKGILKECTRKTTNGGNKKFKMLVDTEWGENLVNPKCPKETQPMYDQDKFCELLKIVL